MLGMVFSDVDFLGVNVINVVENTVLLGVTSYSYWFLLYLFTCMDEGRTKFSSIWIHNVHRSYSSQGTQNSTSRGFAVFWRVMSSNFKPLYLNFADWMSDIHIPQHSIFKIFWPGQYRNDFFDFSGKSSILWTFLCTWHQWLLHSFFQPQS